MASGLRLARLEDLDALPRCWPRSSSWPSTLRAYRCSLRGMPPIEIGRTAGDTLRVPINAHGIDFGSLTLGRRRADPSAQRIASSPRSWRCRQASRPTTSVCSPQSASERHFTPSSSTLARASIATCATSARSSTARRQSGARSLASCTSRPPRRWPGFFGLQVLERDLDQELTRKQLVEVRDVARRHLADLRQLALSVRPPSLDDLGLASRSKRSPSARARAERDGSRCAARLSARSRSRSRDVRLPRRRGRHPGSGRFADREADARSTTATRCGSRSSAIAIVPARAAAGQAHHRASSHGADRRTTSGELTWDWRDRHRRRAPTIRGAR